MEVRKGQGENKNDMTTKTVLRDIQKAMVGKLRHPGGGFADRLDVFGETAALDLLDRESSSALRPELYNINAELPVLRSHIASRTLSAADFQRVNPEVPLEYVIRGRYAANLVPTDDYFLVFDSTDALKEYYRACIVGDWKLDGSRVNAKPMKTHDFVASLRFLYPNFLPDLQDLPHLISVARNSAREYPPKKSPLQSLQQLLQSRYASLRKYYPLEEKQTLLEQAELLAATTEQQFEKNEPCESGGIKVQRSCCVILRNVPAKISIRKITDFFWDLAWFSEPSKRVRPIFTDKTSHLTTYMLCFADPASASRCFRRADGSHLFFDTVLPVVSAELL